MNYEDNEIIITNSYNSHFRKKLGRKIIKLIKKYNVILSGSSVIGAILEETYLNSDFDIYTCIKFKMRNEKEVDSEMDDEIVNRFGGVLMLSSSKSNYKNNNYKYICPHFTINITNVNVNSKFEIYDYIAKTVDIDICNSTYDGTYVKFPKTLILKHGKSINYELINDIDNIANDENLSIYNFNLKKEHLKEIFLRKRKTRLVKYLDRGFILLSSYIICDRDIFLSETHILNMYNFEMNMYKKLFRIAYHIKLNKILGKKYKFIDSDMLLTQRLKNNEEVICIEDSSGIILSFSTLIWANFWIDKINVYEENPIVLKSEYIKIIEK